jgi:type III secretory pathway lipoprotein EscJ
MGGRYVRGEDDSSTSMVRWNSANFCKSKLKTLIKQGVPVRTDANISVLLAVVSNPVDPTSIFTEKNPICTDWKAQSSENARAAMHTSLLFLWKWRRMAVSGQLCRVAEGLS